MRKIGLFALIQLIFLAACGGGGGDGSFNGGGGGGGGGSGGTTANVVPMVVTTGPAAAQGTFNTPFITITVCAPGSTTNCQTIDHVEVDTASYGLRIISSVLNSTLSAALPPVVTPGFSAPVVECTMFGDGYSWGPVRTADLQISGEKAAGIPIQVIGDPGFTNVPSICTATGPEEDTVAQFGANGILGVGPFAQDCGQGCADSTVNHWYYSCPTNGGACSDTQLPTNLQVSNPVFSFPTDNNGVIVQLPSIADAGAAQVTGSLIFGIDTQSNNALKSATVLTLNEKAYFTTSYKDGTGAIKQFSDGFIDSGSNLYYFNDTATINTCNIPGQDSSGNTVNQKFYCPNSTLTLGATNMGQNGTQSNVTFTLANANTVFTANPSFTAFDDVGAPNSSDTEGFDFGLPFFFGRSIYYAIEGRNTSGGMGPYVAY